MGAVWWILLAQLPVVLSTQSVAAHSAAAALAALQDVQRIEQRILDDEGRRISSGDVGPLEAYSFVHQSLGLLFDTALAALRHAVAASPQKELMVEAASLERLLRELLIGHFKEPLFFWHGPKWLIKSKLLRLLGSGVWHEKLKELSEVPVVATDLLGDKAASKEGKARPLLQDSKVPAIGLAVDDTFCSPGGSCNLVEELTALSQLGKESGKASKVHLLILPCPEETLKKIRDALVAATGLPKLFVSVSLPGELLEAAGPGPEAMKPERIAKLMEDYIRDIQKAVGLTVGLVWMPYAAFKKQFWPGTQKMLGKTRSWDYGIHAEVSIPSVAKKLLDRSPKPTAWLTSDDFLRPANEEAVAATLQAGIACVSLPRKEAVVANLTALYFSDEASWPLPWAWHRGLTATVPLGATATLKAPQLELLKAVAFAASHLDLPAKPTGFPLQAALYDARSTLKAAEVSIGVLPPSTSPEAKSTFSPGVSTKTLTGLDEKAKIFKANNHIIYAEDFFDSATFAAIKEETQRLWRSTDIEANCNLDGKNRLGGYIMDLIPRNSSLYRLIYGNDPFRQWVSAVNAEGPMWPSDFPIELREYGMDSKGMDCHPDLQMYKVPRKDLEFAFTVDNDSRCNVTFWDAAGKLHSVQTKPNSLMMVGVNAATHCVSPTEGGSRSILKFIYVGDYRKSNEFWHYTSNECDDANPNRQMLDDRRAQRLREGGCTTTFL